MPCFKKTELTEEECSEINAELQATIHPDILNYNWYEIRITDLDGSITIEKVDRFCMTLSSTYLFCQENEPNRHFHLAIPLPEYVKKKEFTRIIYDYFQCEFNFNNKRTGNSSHSTNLVKNLPCYLTYITKGGDYYSSGLGKELTDFIFSKSFPKTTYTIEVEKICDDFVDDKITKEKLTELVALSKAKYGCYSRHEVEKVVNSIELMKFPHLARNIKINYLS